METFNTGYFAGGRPGPGNSSNVQRIDYSNDTATASERGTILWKLRYMVTDLLIKIMGMFVVEREHHHLQYLTVQRIAFANDTVNCSIQGQFKCKLYLRWMQQELNIWIYWWWASRS